MNIHEFQAKTLLRRYGIPSPDFAVASNWQELNSAIERMGLHEGVLKIQVHAGGRGKAGGVKIGRSREELLKLGEQMFGMKLVNNQTGPQGVVAKQLILSPLMPIKKEYYLGIVIDRKAAQAVIIASPEGGVEIEETAEKHPEKILKVPIPFYGKLRHYQLLQISKFMGWQNELAKEGQQLVSNLVKAFLESDALLLEINPLVETERGHLVALDAKVSLDDNALFRQGELATYYDPTQIPALEARAHAIDLAYIALDGNIGCMVNGAGLAMATMDIIQSYGGKPANFLDVGGSASEEKIAEGFKIILGDPKVKAVLINIFGGIMNCVTLAAGIISAASQMNLTIPLVVRMEGTNVERGKKLLVDSGLNIQIANSLEEAAQLVVHVAQVKETEVNHGNSGK